MVVCKCGTENPDSARFCSNCGSAFPKDVLSVKVAFALLGIAAALSLIGVASGLWLLGVLAIPLALVGLVRLALEMTTGN